MNTLTFLLSAFVVAMLLMGLVVVAGVVIGDAVMNWFEGRRPSSSDEAALITQQGAPHYKGEDAVLANSLDGAAPSSTNRKDTACGD